MSVTFYIDSVGTGAFEFICYADSSRTSVGPFASREAAQAAIAEHTPACGECSVYSPYVHEIHDIEREMNVSNSNAGLIFTTLGMEADWCGSMDAEAFLGHVLVALGTPLDDAAVPTTESQAMGPDGPVGPKMISCGRPAGYLTQRLTTLAEMATEAHRLGRQIVWG